MDVLPYQHNVTLVTWAQFPEWLTPDQAAFLTGHSLDYIQWMIEDGCVECDLNGLLWKPDLALFQESLADVLSWSA